MSLRANYFALAPKAIELLMSQEAYLAEQFNASDTVTSTTWHLVKLRVSQINQCAFCVDMHGQELLGQGETIERVVGLSAWRDMPFFSEHERIALDWAERLTKAEPIDDGCYQVALQALGEQAVVDLTIAVNAINSWNRVAKTFKPEVGSYKP